MGKTIISLLLFAVVSISCNNAEKEIDKVEIAKQYFEVLDNSDYAKMSDWFADSLKTIEGEHKSVYSKTEYLEFLKWDFVFDPDYEILEIEQKDGMVKARISKTDKRISFLHEKPFITNQTLRFQKDKIISVEIDYVNFDFPTWEKNKNRLLSWIDKNHPELNGSINDLTADGGMKLLQAIELYKDRK
ncbi:hypothetical protein ACFQ1M_10275 [Sungkyunkwania multivorans]|uniref:Nuclear transport factor 2 family protein n=1 Tax=Sungkyunkwania multivorans TaxID=1173618 RepID=A0ABW3CXR7_9FLAO